MAPLIERNFRYTWFLATEKRDAMLREGRGEELEKLGAEACAYQESMRRRGPDWARAAPGPGRIQAPGP